MTQTMVVWFASVLLTLKLIHYNYHLKAHGLCGKAEEWKALKAFTKSKDFCDLHTLMKVGEPPNKVHNIYKLNISGVKYIDKS